MKTGDKVRIVKVCAPFISEKYLGKVSRITISDNGIVFLDDLGFNAVLGCIIKVSEDSINEDIEYSVYKPNKIIKFKRF
jgi:hypothetical protein